jgi:release factor glutamine methyltransferase
VHDGVHFFLFEGCLIRVPDEVLSPKFGTLFLARHLPLREGDRALELGTGAGLIAILAARRGHAVVATDVIDACCEQARANALLNGVGDRVQVRCGDLFAPVAGDAFDLIAVNPPQMPTPPERDWDDAMSRADSGGPDGWAVLDRIIREAPSYLKPRGRLAFTLYEFLGIPRAMDSLRAVGLEPRVLARETQRFPRLARERLDYLRGLDSTGVLPPGKPAQCVRLVLCGESG